MSISNALKKQFRSIGHGLHPIVTVAGNGLSEGVLNEIERALEDHELIKIKISITDRQTRKELVKNILDTSRAELVQEIGKIALIFREAKKPHPLKSNVR